MRDWPERNWGNIPCRLFVSIGMQLSHQIVRIFENPGVLKQLGVMTLSAIRIYSITPRINEFELYPEKTPGSGAYF
jgi:hypothetical protein